MGTMGTLIGAFTGMGSCIYLLSHLGTLWNDPSLFVAAEELIALLPEMIEKDSRLDIIAGAAGCIMSLLSLYEVVPSHHVLKIAIQCGDHLLKQARQVRGGLGWLTMHPTHPLTGFSHGTAGIAMSLCKLASVSGEERFFKAAQRAMQYERSLFSVEHNNWLDLHVLAPGSGIEHEQQVFKTAWCHGAPGIGLGRMACLEYVDDLDIRTEIEHAVKTTMAHGFGCDHPAFGSNHSLCHGDFGNLETLLVAAQVLRDPTYQQHLEEHVTRLLDHADARGWVTGVPLNVETPGLMTGLAGIGYELLRIAEPERVPSVLLLASPVRKSN